jgi:hypothetical protein
MGIFQLLYRSHAFFQAFDLSDIDIMRSSIRNNARDGISGFLLRDRDRFVHVIEGGEQAVTDLMARINADPRHWDVEVLLSRTLPVRRFAGWSMGYAPGMQDTDAGQPAPELAGPFDGDARAGMLIDWLAELSQRQACKDRIGPSRAEAGRSACPQKGGGGSANNPTE